jgi:hypothetical protein
MGNDFLQDVTKRRQCNMRACLRKSMATVVYLAFTAQLMVGCGLLPQNIEPVNERASIQNQRIESAALALQKLDELDTLIKLDNKWLADEFSSRLKKQAASVGHFNFRKLKLDFGGQLISLQATVDINDQQGNIISASVAGDITLVYSANLLKWQPDFTQLQISSKDFKFEDGVYAEAVPELTHYVLQTLNTDVAAVLIESGDNSISLNPVPLGEIQVGASLPGFSVLPARHTQALRGMFMVVGNTILIEKTATSIALDLAFIPDLSACPADVTVSRALFTSDVESREPVGIARDMNNGTDVRYFYTEISGAEQPLTIIHYWFADGLPMAVEELEVGPSERWRTWSGNGSTGNDAKRWEVLVVEKETGCILHSQSIRAPEPETAITPVDKEQARLAFAAFQEKFNDRTSQFSIQEAELKIAQVVVRRPFLREVLQSSLSDLSIYAEFDGTALSELQYTARLQPFETNDIVCEQHSCPPPAMCKANLSQCKRFRDTRDCSSCLFRNPLNNRCVKEAVDPICEASRNRQNAKYDTDRVACIGNAEAAKQECDRLNDQALRSCEIETGFEDSVCENIKSSMESLSQETPLAHVSAQTQAKGGLKANFSNFRIEGDLSGLKLDMLLESDLQLVGDLNFSPGNIARPLANCIVAWSTPFKNRFVNTPAVNNMLSNFEQRHSTLVANWSGFGLTMETKPSPLESAFVGNPQLLANCRIGLTVNQVEQAFTGDDAEFFRGQMELEIQPLPTKIHLAPATIELGGNIYSAEADLASSYLRYDIGE